MTPLRAIQYTAGAAPFQHPHCDGYHCDTGACDGKRIIRRRAVAKWDNICQCRQRADGEGEAVSVAAVVGRDRASAFAKASTDCCPAG